MRFANEMSMIWNSNYVDHVQITMAEDVGVGGRAGYYDGIGAARDVIQNHLLQLMSLVAMEEPTSFDADSLRIEKQKVLASVTPARRLDLTTARGQYAPGGPGGEKVARFLEEGIKSPPRPRPSPRSPSTSRTAGGQGCCSPAHRQAARSPRDRGGDRVSSVPPPCRSRRRRPRSSPRTPW